MSLYALARTHAHRRSEVAVIASAAVAAVGGSEMERDEVGGQRLLIFEVRVASAWKGGVCGVDCDGAAELGHLLEGGDGGGGRSWPDFSDGAGYFEGGEERVFIQDDGRMFLSKEKDKESLRESRGNLRFKAKFAKYASKRSFWEIEKIDVCYQLPLFQMSTMPDALILAKALLEEYNFKVITKEILEEEPALTTRETSAPPTPKTAKQLASRRNQERVAMLTGRSKIECYNCHTKGHFARECRSGRSSRRSHPYGDNGRATAQQMNRFTTALFASRWSM
ncbi:ribonuclease H-like domain-containing protein [Tanacetum coccineum]